MADSALEPEPEVLMLDNGPVAVEAEPEPEVLMLGAAAEAAAAPTELEQIFAAVSALLLEKPDAGVKTMVNAMKAEFPGSELINSKSMKQAKAAHKEANKPPKLCSEGHLFGPCNPLATNLCDECGGTGTAYRCGSGCDWDVCEVCHEKDATPEELAAAAATVAAMRAEGAAQYQAMVSKVQKAAALAKGYAQFFDHISLRKEWRTVPFALADVEHFFSSAAVIVAELRRELDVATPGAIKVRKVDGSADEYLWNVKTNPNPAEHSPAENQAFVAALVHETMKDSNGYVEGLTEATVEAAIQTHGCGNWPWVGEPVTLLTAQVSKVAARTTACARSTEVVTMD